MVLFLCPADVQARSTPEKTRLNYRLKWLFNASVAGDIWAESGGFFKRAGLDVTVKEGSPEKNAIKELELGYADFGVASADQVILALEKGADVVVIAQLFQINPMQWIYRADQPVIRTLSDLKGRHIGVTFGGNDESIMNTLLAKGNISRDQIRITGARFDRTPFLTKKVDVWPVYRNSQGVILAHQLAREGESVHFFNPADFGVNFVANSVVTSRKMIKKYPLTVQRFYQALMAAWEAAMNAENEADVLFALQQLDKGKKPEIIEEQLRSTRQLIKPLPAVRIGSIDQAAWQQTEQIMLKQGQIKKQVHVEKSLWTKALK